MHQYTRKVLTEISNLKRGSSFYWHGRSCAVSVPYDISKVHTGRKRISKDERKAMVESFVSKYSEMNAGKFPTVTAVQKQVGGSYYVVRNILQELKYNSKIYSINAKNGSASRKKVIKAADASTDVGDTSNTQLRMDAGIHENTQIVAGINRDIGDSDLNNDGAQERGGTSALFEKTVHKVVVKPAEQDDYSGYLDKQRYPPKDKAEVVLDQCTEKAKHDVKETLPSDVLGLDGANSKLEHQQSPELEKVTTGLSEKQTNDDHERQKKSSLWENIKSFADGFINMWKKR